MARRPLTRRVSLSSRALVCVTAQSVRDSMGKRAATESKKPKATKRVKHVDEAQLEQQKARGSL